ncbi:hypothetical protein HY642_05085 [Candidatus Woesearchaeota archaeon]|nr:hypothetical protein [Candidatus Woesearchaeota archaeon]
MKAPTTWYYYPDKQPPEEMDWQGDAKTLCKDLSQLLLDPGYKDWRHFTVALRGAWLVSAAIDWRIAQPGYDAYTPALRMYRSAMAREYREAMKQLGALADAPAPFASLQRESKPDKYMWQASEPALVSELAGQMRGQCDLLVGSAHGSILPATLLANELGCELHFLRCSRWKRNDTEAVVSQADHDYITSFRDAHPAARVVCFDEDASSGATLELLAQKARQYFPQAKKATVLAGIGVRVEYFTKFVC